MRTVRKAVRKAVRKEKVTIVSPFAGRWACIYQYFKSIHNLDISGIDVHIVFYDNSCDADFGMLLQAFLEKNKSKYRSCTYIVDKNNPVASTGEVKDMIIGRIMNTFKKHIGSSDYVLVVEDDTAVPVDALKKLISDMKSLPKAGCVQGVEVGRHNSNYVGVNRISEIYTYPPLPNKPNPELQYLGCITIQSPSFKSTGVEEIGGGGFYCSLFRSVAYRKVNFEEKLTGCTSVDVIVGPKLRRIGYKWYVDWSVHCTHHTVNAKDMRTIPLPVAKIYDTTAAK